MSSARRRYLLDSGIRTARPGPQQAASLARAYELRSFEIELVWKRATYFLAVQTVVFAAFGLTTSRYFAGGPALAAALAALGFVSAWFGYLAARGARFWQPNWENHIDLLEDELEGKLHKTIVYTGAPQFSVARSQIWLSFVFATFWLFPILLTGWQVGHSIALPCGKVACPPPALIGVAWSLLGITLAVGFALISAEGLRSRIDGRVVFSAGKHIIHPRPAPGDPE